MSDELPKTSNHKFTRGAAYLLEGILQDPRPCDTPAKTVKWGKLYGHIRRANDRTITVQGVSYDHEKARNKILLSFPVLEGEAGAAAQNRKQQEALLALEEANEAWRQDIVEIALTKRQIETAKAAVEYRCKNQDMHKGIVMPVNEHSLNLLTELGLDEE